MVEIRFPSVPEANRERLNKKQLVDYRSHRERFIEWLVVRGMDPDHYIGYADGTVKRTAHR